MAETSSLENRVALVTGGSRGIGSAIAQALLVEGMRVAVTGLSERHLEDALERLPRLAPGGQGRLATIRADVRRFEDMEQAVEAGDVASHQEADVYIAFLRENAGRFGI